MLFTDFDDRVLIVKPNYRDYWLLPGGIVEANESPDLCAEREVTEELGLNVKSGPLLAIDWSPASGIRPRAITAYIFDGGTIAADTPLALQAEELDEARFVTAEQAGDLLSEFTVPRVHAALAARRDGHARYLHGGNLH
ncbi:MAG: NUDIX hydrolase [Corynebacteriales bacterium]|nr:NUDIX hydrolase [Mycobacteriales bacterium]